MDEKFGYLFGMLFMILFLFGVLSGIIAGLFGIGGGMLFTPVLYFLFDLNGVSNPVAWSVGTSLFCTFTAATSSSYQQFSQQNGYLQEGLMLGTGGAAGVSAGKWVTTSAFYSSEVFVLFFSGLIVFVSGMFLAQRRMQSKADHERVDEEQPVGSAQLDQTDTVLDGPGLTWLKALTAGGLGGVVAAMAGIGGGVVMVPVLALLFRMPMIKSVSISSLAVMLISLSGWLQYAFLTKNEAGGSATLYSLGYVDFGIGLPLMMGAFAGGFAGAKTSVHMSERVQVYGFVLLMIIIGTLLLGRTFIWT